LVPPEPVALSQCRRCDANRWSNSLRLAPLVIHSDAIVPATHSDIELVNHRSAARTAMPDLQLGIRVDEA
jgi:hypothetical protein